MITFHFLNVGKGSCTIIEFPNNHLTVIDIDDSRAFLQSLLYNLLFEKTASLTDPINYIKNNFPNKLIYRFILTHPDMDHMSGIKRLFNSFKIINFWDTENEKYIDPESWERSPYYDREDWDFYQKIRKSKENPKVLHFYRDDKIKDDNITVLSPTEELIHKANENPRGEFDLVSYVLMINYAGKKILLPGDATIETWQDILEDFGERDLKSDILLAPGHGSENHINKEILEVIKPDLIIVSIEEGRDYGYGLYNKYGRVFSTKYYGNIKVKIDVMGNIFISTELRDYADGWYTIRN